MIKNVVFDFGGVLMDWDPRYFFRSYFNDDEKDKWEVMLKCAGMSFYRRPHLPGSSIYAGKRRSVCAFRLAWNNVNIS